MIKSLVLCTGLTAVFAHECAAQSPSADSAAAHRCAGMHAADTTEVVWPFPIGFAVGVPLGFGFVAASAGSSIGKPSIAAGAIVGGVALVAGTAIHRVSEPMRLSCRRVGQTASVDTTNAQFRSARATRLHERRFIRGVLGVVTGAIAGLVVLFAVLPET